MPGAAARTSGIAFTIRPQAATIAAWLWSPYSLLGTDVDDVAGLADDLDPGTAPPPAASRAQSGRRSSRVRVTVLDDDRRVPGDHPADRELQRRDGPLLDPAGGDVVHPRGRAPPPSAPRSPRPRCRGRSPSSGWRCPRPAPGRWREEHRRLVEQAAEAHQVEHHLGPVVRHVVGELVAADLLDPLAVLASASGTRSLAKPGSTPVM